LARNINTDEPIYRVVYNAYGRPTTVGDRYIYTDETYTNKYGPYETRGPAKAILTKESTNYKGEPNPAFVGGTIQEGRVHWEDI